MVSMRDSTSTTKFIVRADVSPAPVDGQAQQSIATLSDAQAMDFGKAAGREAFEKARNAGVATPMLVDGKLTHAKPAI